MALWSEVLRKHMLLDYIYNNLILNLSLKHSLCTSQEKLPRHAEELNIAKLLV